MTFTTAVTGYGAFFTTVMGTLAAPDVRRMVSERTVSTWTWWASTVPTAATADR